MASAINNEETKSLELVFAITLNPVLGYLIEPFAVGRTPKNQFEYGFKKVGKNTYWDYFESLPQSCTEVIEVLHKISDENLFKRFGSAKVKPSRFYESLTDEYVARHIRPFIDKVLYSAAQLMAGHKMPLYYKGEAGERIRENPVTIPETMAETCFHFNRQADKTLYRLEVRHEKEDLPLFKKDALLITKTPCLLFTGSRLLMFEPAWDGKKLMPFIEKEYLVVPKSAEKQFFQVFVQKSILHHPFKAYGFEVRELKDNPVPVLKMEEHWQGGIVLGLYFRYGHSKPIRMDDPVKAKIHLISADTEQIAFEKTIRSFDFENEISAFLKSLNLEKIDGPYFSVFKSSRNAMDIVTAQLEEQVGGTIDWFNHHFEILSQKGIECEKVVFNKNFHTGKYTLSLKSKEKNDWFDLYGTVQFGEFEIPFSYLSENIIRGDREYILPDGTIALIPREWMSRYKDIFKFSKKDGKTLRVKKYHYPFLKPLTALKLPGFDKGEKIRDYPVPGQLQAELREYQKQGFNWMMFLRKNKLGGCLADDMGLGKTIQTLTLLSQAHLVEKPLVTAPQPLPQNIQYSGQLDLFSSLPEEVTGLASGKGNCSLIVMPLSLVHNWQEEIQRFAPGLKVLQHAGPARATDTSAFTGYDLVLTTYGTVRNDIDMLEAYHFRYIILDESQIIKNASSRIFSAIKKLQSDYRLVLTGTPIENSLTDLWSQFSFLNPGMLGSLNFFKKEFVTPIEKKNDEIVSDKLQQLITPFILRRTKTKVAEELPPLSEKIHYCEMTPEHQTYYEVKKSQIRNAIIQSINERGPDKAKFFILSGLTKLRLIANHPAIVDHEYRHGSGKFEEIKRNVEKLILEDHKVLIFSQFVKHLNLFRDDFSLQGHPYSLLTGQVHGKDRKGIVDSFKDEEEKQLFLISLKAGGLGLNLTQAGYVFMLDPWWNPAVEKQAINRAHRIGQDKNVFVYKFITRNTVEEKILKLQQKKTNLSDMFINDNNPLKSLSFEELNDLL